MVFKKPATTKGRGTTSSKGSGFQYRPRTAEQMNKRATQSGGSKESFVVAEVNTFTPTDGENRVRILPPTWDDAEHYGIDVWVHYQVGADNSAYICPAKQSGEHCPVCEARAELDRDGDEVGARSLLPKKRVAMFILSRNDEAKGPMLWMAPWTLERDIAMVAIDDGQALALDDPENGYDVIFTREKGGKDVPPKYVGVKAARRPSPVLDEDDDRDALLQWLMDHPIPDCFVHHDSEVIEKAFSGAGGADAKRSTGSGGDAEDDDTPKGKGGGKPSIGGKKPAAEPENPVLPSYEEVLEMEEDDLMALAEEYELDMEGEEFDDLEACAKWVCEQLDIEKPAPRKPVKPGGGGKPTLAKGGSSGGGAAKPSGGATSWKDRLAGLGKKK